MSGRFYFDRIFQYQKNMLLESYQFVPYGVRVPKNDQ